MQAETRTGNGTKAPVKIDDLVEVTIIGTYLVQKLRKPTIGEVLDTARDKLGAIIHRATLKRALEGAQKGNLVTGAKVDMEDGTAKTVYSMKTAIWRAPPELAHIVDLLPVLLKDEGAVAIKAWFDKQEGAGGKKAKRGPDICDYHAFRVTAVTLDPLLGSQINCAHTNAVRKEFPSKLDEAGTEVEGIFERCPLTGDYLIPQDVLQGWFGTNVCRFSNMTASKAMYIAFSPLRIRPKKPIRQMILPVTSRTGPAAPKSYETIAAGEEILFEFMAPTRGFMTMAQLERGFIEAGLRPVRGISPARGRRFGRFLVKSFTDLGAIAEGTNEEFVLTGVPKSVLDEHGSYLRDALHRLKDVKTAADDAAELDAFPGGTTE
jgi:hypothetical protein